MTPDERKKAFKTNPDKIGDYRNASPEKQPEDIEQKKLEDRLRMEALEAKNKELYIFTQSLQSVRDKIEEDLKEPNVSVEVYAGLESLRGQADKSLELAKKLADKALKDFDLKKAVKDYQERLANERREKEERERNLKEASDKVSTAVLTDSFNRLGNAKRLINSKSFKDMRIAAENAIKRDGTPEQVAKRDKEAIDAADNYIRTHKSPRRTKTGRERFNQALRILGAKMEPDTFINYVEQLNQDRGVTDKNSEHYLNADEFIYTSQERELAEARKNLNREDWEAPPTQMTKIVAAYETVNHKKDAKEGDDQLISVAELHEKAKNKWDDPLFREWFSKKGQENIKKRLKIIRMKFIIIKTT